MPAEIISGGANEVVIVETPKPALIEDRDVILKVTGSTVCGSDLHLLHGPSGLSLLGSDSI